ncbi:MAG: hypothetical protein CMK06_11325 [Ponticaulis sp.]|nr:hypothetical protein [Ponticaulis sp.]
MNFISAIILAIVGAFAGSFLQHQFWRERNLEEIKKHELQAALELADQLGTAIDQRLYRQRIYSSEVWRDELSPESLQQYRLALAEWMSKFSSMKSKIHVIFGDETMLHFENVVHNRLVRASEAVKLKVKYDNQLSPRDRAIYEQSEALFRSAELECYRFLKQINTRIEDGSFGVRRYINNLDYGKLNHIRYTYLISRIFNLSVN